MRARTEARNALSKASALCTAHVSCACVPTARAAVCPARVAAIEKKTNEGLNVWMRSPFCSICAFILITSIFVHPEIFVSDLQRFAQFVNGVHAYWNGQFFMSRTVEARTKFVLAKKAAKEQGPPSLPTFLGEEPKADGGGRGYDFAPAKKIVGEMI